VRIVRGDFGAGLAEVVGYGVGGGEGDGHSGRTLLYLG
jgi:hypothetical protein